jgi:hypothetical protein
MKNTKVTIRQFQQEDLQAVLSIFGTTSFAETSANPADSVFASVVSYQAANNNLGMHKGFVLVDEDKQQVIGFYGRLGMAMRYKNETLKAVQSFSAYILPGYPGYFKTLLQDFITINDADIYLSVFPVNFIYSSYTKTGYTEVCTGHFAEQAYILFSPIDFTVEALVKKAIKKQVPPALTFSKLTAGLPQGKKTHPGYTCNLTHTIPANVSAIETYYYQRNYNHIVPVWNYETLKLKYEKNAWHSGAQVHENSAFIVTCTDNNGKVCGLAVAKKLRGFNKLILADLQTQQQDYELITRALIDKLGEVIRTLGYNSLLNIRVDPIYTKVIEANYRLIRRKQERRVYAYMADEKRYADIKILYADDDTNF